MPAPEYRPEGSTSARPVTTSTAENCGPTAPASVRARPIARNGSFKVLVRNSEKLGRKSWSRSTSRNGVGTCRLTTRIISSGVMPLEASAATNEPALVPT
jgi:hypothetical protein